MKVRITVAPFVENGNCLTKNSIHEVQEKDGSSVWVTGDDGIGLVKLLAHEFVFVK